MLSLFIALISGIIFYGWLAFNENADTTAFNLKNFRTFVRLNPNKWCYRDGHLFYCDSNCCTYLCNSDKIQVRLSFPAWLWFSFKIHKEKQSKKEKRYKEVLKNLEKDSKED